MDGRGQPLPWITYPAIRLLARRVPEDAQVFEYGAGNSTLWWEQRVRTVVSCEHDRRWHESVSSAAQRATVVHRDLDAGYVSEPQLHEPFDVIIIDGRRRTDCAEVAVRCLTSRGIVVWDNSQRERYREGQQTLRQLGFRAVALAGLTPGGVTESETTIYYRDGNCLGL